MVSLPSYIKDTVDFINKIKDFKFKSKKSYLVTLDVSSLYTNIPHSDGIDACKHFLNKRCDGLLKSQDITKLIQLVLENNYFKFDDEFYPQKMGTAMGSSMAPSSWGNSNRISCKKVISNLRFGCVFLMIYLWYGTIL